jgi:hypothetical protein
MALDEIFFGARVTAQGAGVEHLDVADRRTGDGGFEARPHDLDLGEFRHP